MIHTGAARAAKYTTVANVADVRTMRVAANDNPEPRNAEMAYHDANYVEFCKRLDRRMRGETTAPVWCTDDEWVAEKAAWAKYYEAEHRLMFETEFESEEDHDAAWHAIQALRPSPKSIYRLVEMSHAA